MESPSAFGVTDMKRNLRLAEIYRCGWLSYPFQAFLALYFLSLGLMPSDALYISAINRSADAVTQPFTGRFADAFGRRRSMAVGTMAALAGLTLYVIPHYFKFGGWLSHWHLFAWIAVGTVCLATGNSFGYGADSALAKDSHRAVEQHLTPREEQGYDRFEQRSTALGAGLEGAFAILGSLWVVMLIGLVGPIELTIVVYGLTGLVVLRLKNPPAIHDGTSLRRVMSRLRRRPHMLAQFAVAAGMSNLTYAMVWLTPFYVMLAHPFGLKAGQIGIVWGIYLLSVPLLFLPVLPRFVRIFDRFKFPYGAMCTTLLGIGAIGYSLVGFKISLFGVFAILMFYFVRTVQVPQVTIYLQSLITDNHERAAVQGFQRTSQQAVYLIIGPILGWIAGRHTVSQAINPQSVLDAIRVAGVLTCAILLAGIVLLYRTRPQPPH